MCSSLTRRLRTATLATLVSCSLAAATALGLHTVATPAVATQVSSGWTASHPTTGGA